VEKNGEEQKNFPFYKVYQKIPNKVGEWKLIFRGILEEIISKNIPNGNNVKFIKIGPTGSLECPDPRLDN